MTVPSHKPHPRHGGQLRQIAASYSIPIDQLIDFSANINPAGPPPSVLGAMQRAITDSASLTLYPDLDLGDLKQKIARHNKVEPENIAIANGFFPLLDAALRSLKLRRCLLPVPCFSEYRLALENAGIAVNPFSLSPSENFIYDAAALVTSASRLACDSLLLANPQNPSGVLCAASAMRSLIDSAREHNITVLLDEAFIDYCPDHSLHQAPLKTDNLIVFRSVTKFFAMPGLRVAYAISNPARIGSINRFIAPWPVTSLACDAVSAALDDQSFAVESRQANVQQRSWLQQELSRLMIATYPSETNFLLLRMPDAVDVAQVRERMIVEERIVLRSCANFEGLPPGHIRIAVRSKIENQQLIHALERVLASALGQRRATSVD